MKRIVCTTTNGKLFTCDCLRYRVKPVRQMFEVRVTVGQDERLFYSDRQPEEITAANPLYRNHYRHEECGTDWEDTWTCRCNDKCPLCGAEIEPHRSEALDEKVERRAETAGAGCAEGKTGGAGG